MSQIKIYISYLPETEEVLLSARVRLILTVMISKVIRKLKVKCKLLPSSGNEEIYMYINLHLTYSILAATLFHVYYSKMSKQFPTTNVFHEGFGIFKHNMCDRYMYMQVSCQCNLYCRHVNRLFKIHTIYRYLQHTGNSFLKQFEKEFDRELFVL